MTKRLFKLSVLMVLVVISLCGCSLMSTVGNIFDSGKPDWYVHAQENTAPSKVSFVGEGNGTTEGQAKLLAFDVIEEKLETYLGKKLDNEQYKRLTTLSSIEEFGLKVENSSIVKEKNGTTTVLILVTADREKLFEAMTEESQINAERAQKAVEYIVQGDNFVKNNQEIEALKSYLKAMSLSYGLTSIDRNYSFDSIFQEVKEIIKGSDIIITNVDRKAVRCTVTVKSKSAIVSSFSKNCSIKASYNSTDSGGNEYEDYFVFITSEKGSFEFKPFDNSIVNAGQVKFSFDLDKEIEELSKVSESIANQIKQMVEDKAIRFTYKRELGVNSLVVTGFCYDENGELVDTELTTNAISDKLKGSFSNVKTYNTGSEFDASEDLADVVRKNPKVEDYIVFKAGVFDTVSSATGIQVVTFQGQFEIYSLETGELTFSSTIVYTNGFGLSMDEAANNAFKSMVELVYSQIRSVYV